MKNENCQDCTSYNNGWCKVLKTNKDLSFQCKFKTTEVSYERNYIDTDSVKNITISEINALYLIIEKQIVRCKKSNDINDLCVLRKRLEILDNMLQTYIKEGGK